MSEGSKPWRWAMTRCTAGTAAVVSSFVAGWYWMELTASRGMLSPFMANNSCMVVSGNVEFLVVEVVVAAADLVAPADDGEVDAVNGDGFADHGTAGKEKRGGFCAEDDDAAAVGTSSASRKRPSAMGTKRTAA